MGAWRQGSTRASSPTWSAASVAPWSWFSTTVPRPTSAYEEGADGVTGSAHSSAGRAVFGAAAHALRSAVRTTPLYSTSGPIVFTRDASCCLEYVKGMHDDGGPC